MRRLLFHMACLLLAPALAPAQQVLQGSSDLSGSMIGPSPHGLWHGQRRSLRYRPEGKDFVILNGERRFNRALYGTHTAFRVEGGDLPEFALYMPGMGGNWRFGLIDGDSTKWLINAASIKAIYRPGSLLYEIKDPLLGNGSLHITLLALADAEGMIIRVESKGIASHVGLCWVFGGATGKKFSRDGDLGADPESSFYCKPEYCRDDHYTPGKNSFRLTYDGGSKILEGLFPPGAECHLANAARQGFPADVLHSEASATPVMAGSLLPGPSGSYYFLIRNPASDAVSSSRSSSSPGPASSTSAADPYAYSALAGLFETAELARQKIAGRVAINTPDPYINTLGGALGIAADAIWEDPSYLHGAVAWRMRLNAWRGPYAADPLGWHDRAHRHFSSYSLSQLTSPEEGPVVADTALHLARQQEKLGTSLFSSGYICRNPGGDLRPHHYDMNLVFIDELLDHFYWTGDTAFVKVMWPLLRRHLDWEKRNFGQDGDGLYDAYCCIWASDALQYSGGGVTHSSAYNYRANKTAADLAVLIGEDPTPYRREANKILQAINTKLWLPAKGSYAEYIDRASPLSRASAASQLPPRIVHPAAALWTVYHAIDSHVPDPFQAWQSLRYIDTDIPHIPVRAEGLEDTTLFTLSTTNWQPYTWSINNVVMAESLHTALACWQGGRPEQAWPLWKGALIESMYLGGSPGNFQQLSFYDAERGELYRDFADPIGMAARSLVEGLFGIRPDALHDTLTIQPGWPLQWKYASLHIPDLQLDYERKGDKDIYKITPAFAVKMNLRLRVRASTVGVAGVQINGSAVRWTSPDPTVGEPLLQVEAPAASSYQVEITWLPGFSHSRVIAVADPATLLPAGPLTPVICAEGANFHVSSGKARIMALYDPQGTLDHPVYDAHDLHATVRPGKGSKTLFLKLQQDSFTWWSPYCFTVIPPVEITASAGSPGGKIDVWVTNHTSFVGSGHLIVNNGTSRQSMPVTLVAGDAPVHLQLPSGWLQPGTNDFRFEGDKGLRADYMLSDWAVCSYSGAVYDTIGLSAYFNDRVTQIFRNQYLSPRPASPTLQLPVQGIGNWCYPLTTANIDDAGLRSTAGNKNEIMLPAGIPLATPGAKDDGHNILFTSKWDNYPDSVVIPLHGKAAHAYFLLAGSTDPMQSRITNGVIDIRYKDGSVDELELNNPSTWWPIEQDYYTDGFAFTTGAPRPWRVSLKTGEVSDQPGKWSSIKGYSNTAIDGGAATVLDLPLHPGKELDQLVLRTVAGDVVIGLMSLTLLRNEKN